MRIAIVTPAFDVAAFIGDAIGSVIAQSHKDWVMVVVDDGSRDGTAQVVARFDDPRLSLIRQDNAGVSAARNRGLDALGDDIDAVMFLDADDWLAPDALARLAAGLAAADAAVAAYGPYGYVNETDRPGARAMELKTGPFPAGDILEDVLERNLFANGGHVLIRRAFCASFDTNISFGEDWEYWVRLAFRGRFVTVGGLSPLLFVRRRMSGTYLRRAIDPNSYDACMVAVFDNPAIRRRLATARHYALRQRAEAENAWVVGRELIRHGRANEAMKWLRRSITLKPSMKRLLLTAAVPVLPWLPETLHGPFRRYQVPTPPVSPPAHP